MRVVCVPSERFAKRALYRLRWERNAGITDTLSQSLADDSSAVIEPATSKDLTAGTTPGSVDPVRVTSAGGANPVDSNSDDVTTSPTTDFLPTAPGAAGKPSSNGATARGQSKKRVPLPTLTLSECGAVLVDPPRDGLDPDTLALIACFPHILYISCNHASLLPALTALSSTHTGVAVANACDNWCDCMLFSGVALCVTRTLLYTSPPPLTLAAFARVWETCLFTHMHNVTPAVRRMVLLDLFPYTKFAECGVWLQQRPAGSTV